MPLAALKRRVRELVDEMAQLADRLDTVSAEIEKIADWLPYRFTPSECCVDIGTLKFRRRPTEAISRAQYWNYVAANFGDMLDDADDRDHWIAVIRRADQAFYSGSLRDELNRSDYVQQAIGLVPDQIFPEQFRFDSDEADVGEQQSIEEVIFRIWPHAE